MLDEENFSIGRGGGAGDGGGRVRIGSGGRDQGSYELEWKNGQLLFTYA